ncbi:hypothetical protein FHX81_3171 [Saccharothrix saharensis]|uniref:Uncharacterized protein n=1 Tax=Saccharothrix saharensis TaxID=571190 RepID=A0A543JD93_9PSEU|nr:hypothetical protein FHX81_3171 [Saccharothrix saharensis]
MVRSTALPRSSAMSTRPMFEPVHRPPFSGSVPVTTRGEAVRFDHGEVWPNVVRNWSRKVFMGRTGA